MREHKQITASLEAADWFVRFQDDRMSRHDQMRYFSWLKQSPVHVAETLRLMRISRLVRSILLPPSQTPKRKMRHPVAVNTNTQAQIASTEPKPQAS